MDNNLEYDFMAKVASLWERKVDKKFFEVDCGYMTRKRIGIISLLQLFSYICHIIH